MSIHYITHVQPVHPLQNTLTRFFIREYNPDGISKTHVLEKEVPLFYYTKPYNEVELNRLHETLANDPQYNHLKFSKHQKIGESFFLRAQGSKEHKENLPKIFQQRQTQSRSPRSPSEQLRWLYPAGLIVPSPYEVPEPQEVMSREYIPLEAIINDNYAVLDIEIEGWEQGKDQIFMIVYVTPQSHILYHNLPCKEDKLNGFDLMQYATQRELGHILTLTVRADDPLWIFGHNIMNFDNIKIRNLTQSYLPTPDRHYPITKSAQGLGKVITRGRFTLDTYAYYFFHRNFHADNKLETIGEFEKDIDYVEQTQLLNLAKRGDYNAFEKLAIYCMEDGLRTEKIASKLRPITALKTHHYTREPDSICATSKTALIRDWWQRHYYNQNGLPPPIPKHDPHKPTISAPIVVNRALYSDFKAGYHRSATIIALTPILAAGYELTATRRGGLLEYYRIIQSSLERLDAALTLQEEITPLLAGLQELLSPPSLLLHTALPRNAQHRAHEIYQQHGLSNDPNKLIANINRVLTGTNAALRRAGVYNAGPTLYALESSVDITALEQKLYGIHLGEGPVLSLKPGVFIANPFCENNPSRFIYQGIRPTKGRKTNFEKRVLMEVITHFFNETPLAEIKRNLHRELTQFVAGGCEAQEYFIHKKTRSFYREEFREVLAYVIKQHEGTDQQIQATNILTQFQAIQHRISDRFSIECKKELRAILAEGTKLYCYPYLLELHDRMERPFPPTMKLIYAEGIPNQMRPIEEGWSLDYKRYSQQVEGTFAVFETIFSQAKHGHQLWLGV